MNIRLGERWSLRSDKYSLILVGHRINSQKRSMKYGKIIEVEEGYYATLDQVFDAILRKEIFRSEAKSLNELCDAVAIVQELTRAFYEESGDGIKELIKQNRELEVEIKRLKAKKKKGGEYE